MVRRESNTVGRILRRLASRIVIRVPIAGALLGDRSYLSLLYWLHLGRSINFNDPQLFTEKLQWLKIYDRNPEYRRIVDKHDAKEWASDIIGSEHIVPTIAAWNNVDEIDFVSLPKQFVLKTTHDSGGVVVCTDKSRLDVDNARAMLKRSLKRQYFRAYGEWPYKDVQPRIIAEAYLEPGQGGDLVEYKFLCFDGKPRLLYTVSGRNRGSIRQDFFDIDFNRLEMREAYPNSEIPPQRPINLEKMLSVASRLSAGLPHVRIDLYEVSNTVIFGEATFFMTAGLSNFEPAEWDGILGKWLHLPRHQAAGEAR